MRTAVRLSAKFVRTVRALRDLTLEDLEDYRSVLTDVDFDGVGTHHRKRSC